MLLGIGSSKEHGCLHISAFFNLHSAHFVLESAESKMDNLPNMKIKAEIAKLNAESKKLYTETLWYPIVLATGFVASIITLTKLFL